MSSNKKVKMFDPKKVVKQQNPMEAFYTPLKPGETNLVTLIASYFEYYKDEVGEVLFLNDPAVIGVLQLNNNVQRVIINKYLNTSLLTYRAISGREVWNIIPYAANDGYIEDWVTVMKDILIPYFAQNKVLNTINEFYAKIK